MIYLPPSPFRSLFGSVAPATIRRVDWDHRVSFMGGDVNPSGKFSGPLLYYTADGRLKASKIGEMGMDLSDLVFGPVAWEVKKIERKKLVFVWLLVS